MIGNEDDHCTQRESMKWKWRLGLTVLSLTLVGVSCPKVEHTLYQYELNRCPKVDYGLPTNLKVGDWTIEPFHHGDSPNFKCGDFKVYSMSRIPTACPGITTFDKEGKRTCPAETDSPIYAKLIRGKKCALAVVITFHPKREQGRFVEAVDFARMILKESSTDPEFPPISVRQLGKISDFQEWCEK